LIPLGKPSGITVFKGGAISYGILIDTMRPSKAGMFFTDKKHYHRLVNPGKEQDAELAILSIIGDISKDNSFKKITKTDIETLISSDLPFFKFYKVFFLFLNVRYIHIYATYNNILSNVKNSNRTPSFEFLIN
jgi:hypothetical protein